MNEKDRNLGAQSRAEKMKHYLEKKYAATEQVRTQNNQNSPSNQSNDALHKQNNPNNQNSSQNNQANQKAEVRTVVSQKDSEHLAGLQNLEAKMREMRIDEREKQRYREVLNCDKIHTFL